MEKPAVVAITETKLDPGEHEGLFADINTHLVFRKDRNKYGGGVALLVDKNLFPILCDFACIGESVFVDCNISGIHIRIGCQYRPPADNNAFDCIATDVYAAVNSCIYPVVLVGDINIPGVDWVSYSTNVARYQAFIDYLISHGFAQFVNEPTRFNPDNILDLVFCNNMQLLSGVHTDANFGCSDHCSVVFDIAIPFRSAARVSLFRNFRRADPRLDHMLALTDWDAALFAGANNSGNAVEGMWTAFSSVLNDGIERFVPLGRRCEGWRLPLHIVRLNNWRISAWKQWRREFDYFAEINFHRLTDLLNCALFKHFAGKEREVLRSGNIGAMFRYCRSKLGPRRPIPVLKVGDRVLHTDDEKAAAFSSQFLANFQPSTDASEHILPSFVKSNFSHVNFDVLSVYYALRALKPSFSRGCDGIPSYFYKHYSVCVAYPLSIIFDFSFNFAIVPRDWKDAIVVPIYKGKGGDSDPGNYRDISLTPAPARLMEAIINRCLLSYLLNNDLISRAQYGFLPNRSTVSQLLSVSNFIVNCVDDKRWVDVVYLDLRKAFTSVSHSKLLLKLRSIGVCGKLLSWLCNFLSGRRQRVIVNGKLSGWENVISGVPQGSCLGPTLFIIYINDLCKFVDDSIMFKFYADDLKLYMCYDVSCLDMSRSLQNAITNVFEYGRMWDLNVNFAKCEIIHYGFSNPKCQYSIGNHLISVSDPVRDLGVYFSSDLKFSFHCQTIVASAFRIAFAILRSFVVKDANFLCKMYTTFVRPRLEYATVIFNPYLAKDIRSIEYVQRRFTKCIPQLANLPYLDRCARLGLHSLQFRRLVFDLVFVYKLCNGLTCLNPHDLFVFQSSRQGGRVATRGHPLKIYRQRASRNCKLYHFCNRIVEPWNSLPSDVVLSRNHAILSLKLFALYDHLKDFLLVDEFVW